jgi:predicted RNA-binding protein with PUA-like domain
MRYWLMKSEPDCYSIDDLKKTGGPAMWEGCRNYVVRNYFKNEMSVGDEAFFYHSSTNPPGIVGTMKIVSEAYPDPTQFDPESDYYDPKSRKEAPKWLLRDVLFTEKYPRMITLEELRNTPAISTMLVLRKGQRLSVMPVEKDEWDFIQKWAKEG